MKHVNRRTVAIVLGLPVYLALLLVTATLTFLIIFSRSEESFGPGEFWDAFFEVITDTGWWIQGGFIAAGFAVTQMLFLLPLTSGRPPATGKRSRRLTASLLLGGLIAGLLTGGLGLIAVDAMMLATDMKEPKPEWWLLPLGLLIGGWIFWTGVILFASGSVWPDRALGRLAAALLAGTIVESLIVLPIDIMIRRRTDCYCATGSFFTLSILGAAVIWLAGPGVVIALCSRRHRRWRETHCGRCGHPHGPSPGSHCPECGQTRDVRAAAKAGKGD